MVLLNLSSVEEHTSIALLNQIQQEKFDYSMNKVTNHQYNEKGELGSSIYSEKLFHFPNRQQIQLEQPQFKLHKFELSKQQQEWILTANKGLLNEHDNQLLLLESVKLNAYSHTDAQIDADKKDKKLSLEISELNIDLNKRTGFSSAQVSILSDQWTIKGVGLDIDLENQSIEILNRVYSSNE